MVKPKPIDLNDFENTILAFFDREKDRLNDKIKGKDCIDGYFAGRLEELAVMRRTIRTHLKKEIKERIKQAVQGLLSEIEGSRVDIEFGWDDDWNIVDNPDGEFVRYDRVVELIRKLFADVVENNEKG